MSEGSDAVDEICELELRTLLFDLTGLRPHANFPVVQIQEFFRYNQNVAALKDAHASNVANELRDIVMRFIAENRNELSLACDGNCYAHSDAVVAGCYEELQLDTAGQVRPEILARIFDGDSSEEDP